MYGIGGARISAQDGCTVRIDPDGSVVAATGVTEQGQGTEAIIRQIVAEGVGVPIEQVRVITGDTLTTPYGGGTWACRGAGIGGEAALQSGLAVKEAALKVAGAMLQAQPDTLDLVNGEIVERATGQARMPLAELARIVYFRGDTLPPDLPRELMQTRHFITKEYPFAFTNGVQACYAGGRRRHRHGEAPQALVRAGLRAHHHPLLVDEQVRGGIVQGIGGALYEHCTYSPRASCWSRLLTSKTPCGELLLGAKGAGEAGWAGAPAAIMNAINDALSPSRKVVAKPFTPERILVALGKVPDREPGSSQVRTATTPIGAAPNVPNVATSPRSGGLLDRLLSRSKG